MWSIQERELWVFDTTLFAILYVLVLFSCYNLPEESTCVLET